MQILRFANLNRSVAFFIIAKIAKQYKTSRFNSPYLRMRLEELVAKRERICHKILFGSRNIARVQLRGIANQIKR